MDHRDSFLRSAGLIAALTLLSRLLGLVRDMSCAALFGAGMVWDAFSFAFRVPNMFRGLFGEGALGAAFIPAFTESLETQPREASQLLAGRVAAALGAALLAVLIASEAVLFGIWRWGGLDERWRLALSLTALMLPYMPLICLTALAGGILQSMSHFAAPALAPVILNVCWIAGAVLIAPAVSATPKGRIHVVAAAILASGALQLLLQLAVMARKSFRWKLSFEPLHADVKRVASSMAPVAIGLAALELNVLLDGVLAISLAAPAGSDSFSLLGLKVHYPMVQGANSVLYYANRLMQMPLGVFGVALATAAFPTFSALAARRDWSAFAGAVQRALGAALFIAMPAGVGLMILARPAVELLFERGQFTRAETVRTAAVVLAYSSGLWAYCLQHVLARAFYSLREPAVPAKVAGCMVALNLGLNLTLVWFLAEAGLAAATAACSAVQVCLLYALLNRRVKLAGTHLLLSSVAKTAAATAVMTAATLAVLSALGSTGQTASIWEKLLRLIVPTTAGCGAYAAAAAALKSEEFAALVRQISRRRKAQ